MLVCAPKYKQGLKNKQGKGEKCEAWQGRTEVAQPHFPQATHRRLKNEQLAVG